MPWNREFDGMGRRAGGATHTDICARWQRKTTKEELRAQRKAGRVVGGRAPCRAGSSSKKDEI